MGKIIDLKGRKFGKLSVIHSTTKRGSRGEVFWLCKCECGMFSEVHSGNLKSGNTKSCNYCPERNYKHGMYKSSEYKSYLSMLSRCYNPNAIEYKNYGGRGIRVCDRWLGENGFINFLEDMGIKSSPELSLDKYPNNDGIYEKSNCRWATFIEQQNNRTDNRWIEYNGEKLTLRSWTRRLSAHHGAISGMLKRKSFDKVYEFYMNKNKMNEKRI